MGGKPCEDLPPFVGTPPILNFKRLMRPVGFGFLPGAVFI